jgi:hypothetical protein
LPESSSEDEDDEATDTDGEGSGDSSGSDSNAEENLDMKKILRRSTSLADIAETFALCGDLYKFVN